jgi:hypothetical protein
MLSVEGRPWASSIPHREKVRGNAKAHVVFNIVQERPVKTFFAEFVAKRWVYDDMKEVPVMSHHI